MALPPGLVHQLVGVQDQRHRAVVEGGHLHIRTELAVLGGIAQFLTDGKDLPGGKSVFTVRFEVKNVAELEAIRNRLLNIRDVISSRRGQN